METSFSVSHRMNPFPPKTAHFVPLTIRPDKIYNIEANGAFAIQKKIAQLTDAKSE